MNAFVQTKIEKPQLAAGIIMRPRLVRELNAALERRLILVSAPAGYGKTTLLTEWLHASGLPWAWLSLDADDNDLVTFLKYLLAALRAIHPDLGVHLQAALKSARLPPSSELSAALVSDLSTLSHRAVLVLEDYHLIRERAVHELISAAVYRIPSCLHLVISTRSDPPIPLGSWRGRGYLSEIRATELRFNPDEASALLKGEIGVALPEKAIAELLALTEGWVVGLKLAALSIRDRITDANQSIDLDEVVAGIQSVRTNQAVADYLLEDVFSRQPLAIRDFMMRTSILDRFTAPLCDALDPTPRSAADESHRQAAYVLKWMVRSNLFLVQLDAEGMWFRYHHLFRELLIERLAHRCSSVEIAQLHNRAGEWLASQGLIGESLPHFLAAGEPGRAADVIERHRHTLLDNEEWHTLWKWLDMMPNEVVQRRPALLATRAWILSVQGRTSQVAVLVRTALAQHQENDGADHGMQALSSELDNLRSQVALINGHCDEALRLAELALDHTPRAHGFVFGLAITIYGLGAHAEGKFEVARDRLDAIWHNEPHGDTAIALRVLLTIAWVSCLEGKWDKAKEVAEHVLRLVGASHKPLMAGWAHLFLGWHCYQRNELELATLHFESVVRERYGGANWRSVVSGLTGLSMSHWAAGRLEQADAALEALTGFALDARDPDPLCQAEAYRAHYAILQGDIATAMRWANAINGRSRFVPFLWMEAPLITQLRAYVADRNPASLERADALFPQALAFAQSTHNVWRQVELRALHAVSLYAKGEVAAALDELDGALGLAEPGHFIRSFIDLGPELTPMLVELERQGRHAAYAHELASILDGSDGWLARGNDMLPTKAQPGIVVEPLTGREQEVLELMAEHMTNDEIAQALFISPLTVKSHIRSLFGKLGVNRRRFAIARAKNLGLLE